MVTFVRAAAKDGGRFKSYISSEYAQRPKEIHKCTMRANQMLPFVVFTGLGTQA